MNPNSFKTFSAKPHEVVRKWHLIDARGQVVGRLASRAAHLLRGKHKPSFTPHVDTGDFVVVINAAEARFTGQKETQKEYFKYSGYPGGERLTSPETMRRRRPTFLIEHAVKGMLPRGPLGRKMFKKLKVYAGPEHPHDAQQPEAVRL